MSIKSDVQSIEQVHVTTLQSIVSAINSNFKKLRDPFIKFLDLIGFNEDTRSITLTTVNSTNISTKNIKSSSQLSSTEPFFSVDDNGYAKFQSITSRSELKGQKLFLDMTNGDTNTTVGQIIYGTYQGLLDFWGNVNGLGWVSLTGLSAIINIPDLSQLKWAGSVINTVTAPPVTPEKYGRYLIDWMNSPTGLFAGHRGEIAQYDFLSSAWSFKSPEDGTFIIHEGDYNKAYVAEVSGTDYTWSVKSAPSIIGDDEGQNIIPYQNGLYTDFTENTTVGTAVDRFNKALYRIYTDSMLAYKHTMGKSHTSSTYGDYQETYSHAKNISVSSIFVSDIPSDVNLALQGDEPIAVLVDAPLQQIHPDGSAYYATWPNPLPTNAPSIAVAGARITNMIGPEFGEGYRAILYGTGNTPIANDDARKWCFQYNSGILFQATPSNPVPTSIQVYVYRGEFLSKSLTNVFKLTTADKNLHVASPILGNGSNTGIRITDTPRKGSSVMVFVDGIKQRVGNGVKTLDCYFSPEANGTIARNLNDIAVGDYLIWNASPAGTTDTPYNLLPKFDIELEYLTPTDVYQAVPPAVIATNYDFPVGSGSVLSAGDFVHIYNQGGSQVVRRADSTVAGRKAHGYVLSPYVAGDIARVYFDGINDKMAIAADINDADRTIFLGPNGGVTMTPTTSTGNFVQELGWLLVADKMMVEIGDDISIL